jgi:hypothetical protein
MAKSKQMTVRPRQRCHIQNPISISDMRDAVVDEGTYSKYVNEIIPFIKWLRVELPSWLTPYCSEQHDAITILHEDEGIKQWQKQVKASWMHLIKNAGSHPLIYLNQMTADGVMTYIRMQANQRTGKYLSGSSYKHLLSFVAWWPISSSSVPSGRMEHGASEGHLLSSNTGG